MEQYTVITWFLQWFSRSVHQNMCSILKTSAAPDLLLTHTPLNHPWIYEIPKSQLQLHSASHRPPRRKSNVPNQHGNTHLTELREKEKRKSESHRKGYKKVEGSRKTRLERGWGMKWWKREKIVVSEGGWYDRQRGRKPRRRKWWMMREGRNGWELYHSDSDEMFSASPCLSLGSFLIIYSFIYFTSPLTFTFLFFFCHQNHSLQNVCL